MHSSCPPLPSLNASKHSDISCNLGSRFRDDVVMNMKNQQVGHGPSETLLLRFSGYLQDDMLGL